MRKNNKFFAMGNFEKNVFINCPYDDDYRPLLRPLLFTILWHRYEPKLALLNSDSGLLRLEKIKELISDSKFSIHDLSRMQATKAKEFFRLNMPFEPGIDFGYRCIGPEHTGKRFLILDKHSHRYMKAISDINGLDIKFHQNKPQEMVRCVRNWFVETAGFKNAKSPTVIQYDFTDFYTQLYEDKTSEDFSKCDIELMPVAELIDHMKSWLRLAELNEIRIV